MSYLTCPHCDERIDVFSHGGGKRTAQEMEVNFLGELPLDPDVRIGGDTGEPVVRSKSKSAPFLELARRAAEQVEIAAKDEGPKIEISD